jgi:hypothetical protein
VADIRLIFDAIGQRWEGVILPVDQWTALDEYNDLLTIAYSDSGALAGFVFDLDSTNSATSAALSRVRELFGDVVVDRVSLPDDTATAGTVAPLSSTAVAETAETAIFPVLGSVNARARDVAIVDDASRGIVKISMRLPWWTALLRPWVTVRRRGRPEVIALGPMRRAKGVHTAELHYGLPTPTSSLVAEVIRGTRGAWVSGIVAAVVTASLVLGGLAIRGGDSASDAATPNGVVTTVEATTPPEAATTLAPATTMASDAIDVATTLPPPPVVETTTSPPAVTTTKPPRTSRTTVTTLLPPGGVSFVVPSQYITGNDTRADVTVDRQRVQRGDTINVSVRISGVFVNPFDRGGITDLPELIAACRALIGVGVTVSPTPGWSPNVSVSLAGTGVTGGGSVQLVVIGNIATECGDVLISTNPTRINVVRTTFYREVPISLRIPSSLRPGQYSLLLDRLDFNGFIKATPIDITVTE